MMNYEAALLEEDRGGGTATCDCDDEEQLVTEETQWEHIVDFGEKLNDQS